MSIQGKEKILLIIARCVGGILLLTAGAKFLSVIFAPASLKVTPRNPVFPWFSEPSVIFLGVIIEVITAICLWRRPVSMHKFFLVIALSVTFFMYRFTLKNITFR